MKKFIFFLLTATFLQASDTTVVVSNNPELGELSKAEIQRLFLAKTDRVQNMRIKVVELQTNLDKDRFYKEISGKSKSQLRSYWTRLIFTGKAKPPKQLEDMQELLKEMEDSPNIITYLSKDKVTDGMKILYTLKE